MTCYITSGTNERVCGDKEICTRIEWEKQQPVLMAAEILSLNAENSIAF